MKPSQILLTSLGATAALAQPQLPLAFFANISDTMVRLSGDVADTPRVVHGSFSVLSHASESLSPVEFSLENGYAKTTNEETPGYVGFFHNLFAYGSLITKEKLDLDKRMQVHNADFYSCNGDAEGSVQWIGRNASHALPPSCIGVEVYLLPFDKKTGKPVEVLV